MPRWRYTHLPFGELRAPATTGRLKAMGVKPGWPDFHACWARPHLFPRAQAPRPQAVEGAGGAGHVT